MYTVLVLMSTIIYFIPYLFLSVAYISLRHNKVLEKKIISDTTAYIVASLMFISITVAICLALIPTEDLKTRHDIIIYELELIGGPILFALVGVIIYIRKKTRNLIVNSMDKVKIWLFGKFVH